MIPRLVLLVILLVFRFYDLGIRPPHHDEAVNGWFVDGMFNKGFYQYDPQNYHGPMFFYILALFEKIFGRSIEVLRLPIVLFSWAVTCTPLLFKKWLGERGSWISVFFLAVSPAMIFYSRYTIHEMEFMLSCILFFYYWLETRSGGFTRKNSIGLGLTLGAMACLKENFILYLACLGIAEAVARAYERYFPAQVLVDKKGRPVEAPLATNSPQTLWRGLGIALGLAFALIVVFYSGFFQDWKGIGNFFKAFYFWSETGSDGHGHQKPVYYWLKLMFEMEWFALFGLLLAPLALRKVGRELRLVSIVTMGLLMAYSLVSYKTPWCLMSFYWGFILIAAYWVGQWMENKSWNKVLAGGLILGFGFSAWQGYAVSYVNVDHDDQPYIYGQTYRDVMVPLNTLLESGKKNPALYAQMRIQIVSDFTWPLPFILGEFKMVGYHTDQNAPPQLDADWIIIDEKLEPKYVSRIQVANYSRSVYRARQWASALTIYKKNGL